ncbi:unnamed protein product, partial [Phyllotreta striolata]
MSYLGSGRQNLLPRKAKSLSHFNVTQKLHKMGTELADTTDRTSKPTEDSKQQPPENGGAEEKEKKPEAIALQQPVVPQCHDAKHASAVSRSPSGPRITSADNHQRSTDGSGLIHPKKSSSFVENKPKFSSERLMQLKRMTEIAVRDHKVFTIRGGWPVIRRELLKRNWLEKIEPAVKPKFNTIEDVVSNIPIKQDWESTQTYEEKIEKMIISRLLQSYDVDFYWSMRKEQCDIQQRANPFKLINRFSRSLFASKEGLALLLQQSYWYNETGVAAVSFPRTYVLGFPDHYNFFVEDFRLTACIGLLKWFVEVFEKGGKANIQSIEGRIPYASLQFALDRCNDFVAKKKHLDIDRDFPQVWDHEWDQFLKNYYNLLHEDGLFSDFTESLTNAYGFQCIKQGVYRLLAEQCTTRAVSTKNLVANVKATLKDVKLVWPQYDIDGMKNIWILKPGNKCRGRGIHLVRSVSDVDRVMNLKMKYVVQKYIERPMIIYKTKFDIRQWFLVTCVQPLTIWIYRDSYLRFSGQIFSLENFHESLHLTNHAVQCKYTPMEQRDKALPTDNMWDCNTFKAYLKQMGCLEKWNEVIFPGMAQSITCAMLASQDTMDKRQNTFEMYGADFMLGEDCTPWLLEINCSPDLSFSTSVTSRLCPQCMEDIIKVVVDKRRDINASTGLFELIYKQNYPRAPPYLGLNLSVRGRKIFKTKSKSNHREKGDKEKALMRLRKHDFVKSEFMRDNNIAKLLPLPKLICSNDYSGPVISDFIEEIQKVATERVCGVDFIPSTKSDPHHQNFMNHHHIISRNGSSNNKKIDRVLRSRDAAAVTKPKTTDASTRHCRRRSVREKNKPTTSRITCGTSNWTNLKLTLADTAMLLNGTKQLVKGTNVFTDINKNDYKCLNLHVFDLNEML